MQNVIRLIDKFKPNKYKLTLNLDRTNRKFSGLVIIDGDSISHSQNITLHSKELDIKSVTVDNNTADFTFGDNDTLIISYPNLIDGSHTIVIDFCGKITDTMNGLYPCYCEHDGIKKELLATQFESHHAREVLPCVDEPAAKATFDVTLITENNVTVLGNMPIKSQISDDNSLTTIFETTPIMSCYLLAWVVGELHKKTAYTKSGVEVNVWATPAQPADNLDFALDIATRSIDFFDEYFDTPYPLTKCDHVALPDFSSGAMENWGLITYREIALLVDPVTTSIQNKHYAALVIAHELSHQWFGNLVTMEWWNDLWLNESFATLIEYVAVDALEPSWNVWLNFASSESIAALRRDSLEGVQSIQTDVKHPDEISTLFDGAIVYAKGARLLDMLRQYIGESAFQTGLKHYFQIHAYKNTRAIDLWTCLSESSGKDIASLMTSWISQPGFPVLHVTKKGDELTLTQNKLSYDSNNNSDTIWPITVNSNCNDIPKLIDSRSVTVKTDINYPLELNIGNHAHFITHYSNDLLSQLIQQIKNGKLSPIDRLKLLNEQTLLARAGIISSAELIPLIDAFKDETTEAVWGIISMTISELKKFTEDDKTAESKLRALAESISDKQFQKLGWTVQPGETISDSKLRDIIIGLKVYSEAPDIIDNAIKIYKTTPLDKLDPELRSLILIAAVRHNESDTLINELLAEYKNTGSAELKQDICVGLTSTKKAETVSQILNLVKDTNIIRTQDTAHWIIYLIRNKHGRVQTWQWIIDNWDWITATFGDSKDYDDYPRYCASAFSTKAQLDQYINFFTPLRADTSLTRAIDMGINEIKNRFETIEKDGQSVRLALLNL